LIVLGLCALFIHAFRDRLRLLEVLALVVVSILTSVMWSGYFIAIDPATSEILKVPSLWQWFSLILAIGASFAFLLSLGYWVDGKPKTLRKVAPTA
jgi:hypothetical protein